MASKSMGGTGFRRQTNNIPTSFPHPAFSEV